jgi:hypothetical protein
MDAGLTQRDRKSKRRYDEACAMGWKEQAAICG